MAASLREACDAGPARAFSAPRCEPAWKAWSYCVIACAVQFDSAEPQLIDSTDGLFTVSIAAWLIASRNPASVLGAK